MHIKEISNNFYDVKIQNSCLAYLSDASSTNKMFLHLFDSFKNRWIENRKYVIIKTSQIV